MASGQHLVATSLLPVIFLAFIVTVPVCSDEKFLKNICSQTETPDLCLSMLRTEPRSINCTDLPCALGICANAAQKNAFATDDFIGSLLGAKPEPPEYDIKSLSLCSTCYGEIIYNLDLVIKDIGSQDYNDAFEKVVTAEKNMDICETAFDRHPHNMTNANKKMGDTMSVVWIMLDELLP